MRVIDTDALRGVAATLGIGNPASVREQTQFDDDVLQQILDVTKLVRRSGTPFPSSGIFGLTLALDFASTSSTLSVNINPWSSSSIGLTYGQFWPGAPLRDGLDFWLLGPLVVAADNISFFTDGGYVQLSLSSALENRGIFYPAANVTNPNILLGFWDIDSAVGNVTDATGWGLPQMPYATRLRRGDALIYRGKAQTDLIDYGNVTLNGRIGLFPAGLGQDAIGAG